MHRVCRQNPIYIHYTNTYTNWIMHMMSLRYLFAHILAFAFIVGGHEHYKHFFLAARTHSKEHSKKYHVWNGKNTQNKRSMCAAALNIFDSFEFLFLFLSSISPHSWLWEEFCCCCLYYYFSSLCLVFGDLFSLWWRIKCELTTKYLQCECARHDWICHWKIVSAKMRIINHLS